MPQNSGQNQNADEVLGREREILRALCTSAHSSEERSRLLKAIASHEWREAEHRVVYEALLRTVSRDSEALRLELPATATRMGFPDIEWGEYFKPSEISEVKDVENHIHQLAVASAKLASRP